MVYKIIILIAVILAFSIAAAAQSDFPYEKYKPRTISEILAISAEMQKKPDDKLPVPNIIFSADFLHSQVRVKFQNKSRPIPAERKELLGQWQKVFSVDGKLAARFTDEYLFTECGVEYWMPVQSQVASYFPKELKEGDMITLYLIRSAGRKTKDGFDWIFLVNEFEK
jgi:hypothetical protein